MRANEKVLSRQLPLRRGGRFECALDLAEGTSRCNCSICTDPNSFMSKQPDWKPWLPSQREDDFTMGDLLRLVGEINPIGGS